MSKKSNYQKTEYDKFIEKIAKDVYKGLSQKDKDYLFDHPDSSENHFGLGLYIRNHYELWDAKICRGHHPDDMSSDIVERVSSYIIPNYDYYNTYYRYVYGSDMTYLRRLYHSMLGEYPDNTIYEKYKDYADEQDAYNKAKKDLVNAVINLDRFNIQGTEYGLKETQIMKMVSFVDEYNAHNWKKIPYDIGLLGSKTLEEEKRNCLLNLLNSVLKEWPRIGLEMPTFVFNQKDAALVVVSNFGECLKRMPKFNSDDDIIRAALTDSGEAIQYVNKELREKPEYMRIAFSDTYSFRCALNTPCMKKYRDSDEWVKLALEANGVHIMYASQRIKGDFEMAKIAIEHDDGDSSPSAMSCLSKELRDNEELALLDITKGGADIRSYSFRLRNSEKIAKALLKTENKWKIYLMSKKIREKYEKQ